MLQRSPEYFLEDTGSTNGTFVNGRRLDAGEAYRLRAGDEVSFANICRWIFDDPVTTTQIDPVQLPRPGLEIDQDAARVLVGGVPLYPPLSPNQFSLLAVLYENAGRIVTREEICESVWGTEEDITDQTIDALVSRLRKRLFEIDRGSRLHCHAARLWADVPESQAVVIVNRIQLTVFSNQSSSTRVKRHRRKSDHSGVWITPAARIIGINRADV